MRIKLDDYLKMSLYFSSLLRLCLQDYFELSLITFLVYKEAWHFDSWISLINSLISILAGIYLLIIPLIVYIFLHRNEEKFLEEDYKKKYSTLFEN